MIEIRNLCKSYSLRPAVHNLCLRVEPGEIYGFLGPNGAGKTTTLRVLAGLLKPDDGDVSVGGFKVPDELREARRVVAFVSDTPPLYDYLTGREYVDFVASLYGVHAADRDARREHFLAAFGLADRAGELCKGYSHGMRKKIHLAAMLVTSPKVLLLDEPTNGLDPSSARLFKDAMIEIRKAGVAVMLSTHLLDTAAELCDRIGILSDGKLAAEGTLDELLAAHGDASLEAVFLRWTGQPDGGTSTESASGVTEDRSLPRPAARDDQDLPPTEHVDHADRG